MEYPLGPVPWSLATADGMPIKMDKAALMTKLEEESSYKYPEKERDHVHVIDGNALFHNLTQIPTGKRYFQPSSQRQEFISSQTTTMICLSKHQRG